MSKRTLDNGFLLLYEWLPAFKSLPSEDAITLLYALIDRQLLGTPLPEFKNTMCNVFAQMIEPTIKRRLDGQIGGKIAQEQGTTQDTTQGTTQDTTVTSEAKRSKEKKRENKRLINQSMVKSQAIDCAAFDDMFDRFWKAYPKKKAKEQAKKTFIKLKPTEELLQKMLSAIEAQKRSDQWVKDNGAFIPHASTWLNGKRWEDEATETHSKWHDTNPHDYDFLYEDANKA